MQTKYKLLVTTEMMTTYCQMESDAAVFPSLFMDFAKKYGLKAYFYEDGELKCTVDSFRDYFERSFEDVSQGNETKG